MGHEGPLVEWMARRSHGVFEYSWLTFLCKESKVLLGAMIRGAVFRDRGVKIESRT